MSKQVLEKKLLSNQKIKPKTLATIIDKKGEEFLKHTTSCWFAHYVE
jgi:hypothetical protein